MVPLAKYPEQPQIYPFMQLTLKYVGEIIYRLIQILVIKINIDRWFQEIINLKEIIYIGSKILEKQEVNYR